MEAVCASVRLPNLALLDQGRRRWGAGPAQRPALGRRPRPAGERQSANALPESRPQGAPRSIGSAVATSSARLDQVESVAGSAIAPPPGSLAGDFRPSSGGPRGPSSERSARSDDESL